MNRSAKKSTFKPTMETLESRWCPATSISPLQNGVVTVTGDDNINNVRITQNDATNMLVILTENVGVGFTSDQVTDVVINLKGGNDQLTYRLDGGSGFLNGKRISVDLGAGDDTATFDFAADGTGGLARVQDLNLDIQGGAGKDSVDAFIGSVMGGSNRRSDGPDFGVTVTGNMGLGDDRFNAELRDIFENHSSSDGHPPRPTLPSSMRIDMEDMNDLVLRDPFNPRTILATIPGGNDEFSVTSGVAFLQHNGRDLDVTLKGGDGNDTLRFQSQGELHGNLTLVLDGQNGADVVTADIALDAASGGSVNATVRGGNGDDTVALMISSPGTTTVQGLLDGGNGFDHGSKSANVADQNCEVVPVYFNFNFNLVPLLP